MDALLSALVAKLPELGIAGLALMLLLTSWRNATADRGDYRTALRAAEDRHAAEIARINREHDAEVAELNAAKAELRLRLAEVNTALDREIEARRAAEGRAAKVTRRRGDAP